MGAEPVSRAADPGPSQGTPAVIRLRGSFCQAAAEQKGRTSNESVNLGNPSATYRSEGERIRTIPGPGKAAQNPEKQPRTSTKELGGKQESPPIREPPAP